MAKGDKTKSPKWHEAKRRRYLVDHLQRCLDSGRYAGDVDRAVSYIVEQRMELALLEQEVAQGEV